MHLKNMNSFKLIKDKNNTFKIILKQHIKIYKINNILIQQINRNYLQKLNHSKAMKIKTYKKN